MCFLSFFYPRVGFRYVKPNINKRLSKGRKKVSGWELGGGGKRE